MAHRNMQAEKTSRWQPRLAIAAFAFLAVIAGTLIWLFFRPADDSTFAEPSLPSTHPIFGKVYETSATDVMEMPEIRGPNGLLPRIPVYLVVDSGLLEWSAVDVQPRQPSGYLYFWDPASTLKRSNVWAFAACGQSGLANVTEKDLKADFCDADGVEAGRAAFGTNWVVHGRRGQAILLREGQIILARNSTRPARIYALEMTKQDRGNLRVRYIVKVQ